LRTYLDQAPGVPLVLPTTLPPQYVFLGPGFEQSANGAMFVRTFDFRLGDTDTSQVIEICVATPGSSSSTCVPAGAQKQAMARKLGEYPVWIRPLGSDEFREGDGTFWKDVPLSDDLDAITWLT
jgi:hypothetical protein